MHASIIFASALFASAYAAPAYPALNMDAAMPGSITVMSEYFNMLARKVQEQRAMSQTPVCDLSMAQLPTVPGSKNPMPPPSAGLALKHIALGRGTQNYTCDAGNATAAPVAAGALATLFNASCVGSYFPQLLNQLSKVTILFNLTGEELDQKIAPSNLAISGHHYFTPDATVPFFDLDVPGQQLGRVSVGKNASEPAPADAPRGQQGEAAVAWLKLTAKPGMATGELQEVYRVGTAGGSPPATCKDMPAKFEVQYTAQYWFYAGKPSEKKN
ncbi:malate dehydrogenase [Gaeumannomyces tritici R3-111a-1]|uniref:Malate dehydrogenase n=1 Tax=Gaeumannomyces tritici (strain R3-111a-1) TaxID=644352 RepID=J3PBH2_GAET3|nr:malate dehydrogenase [Gaeumannomyces tritici R3-111a-1]EJT71589.1 malate dehydrogenase [Gaeumannomyces tritici R3-111a-1]